MQENIYRVIVSNLYSINIFINRLILAIALILLLFQEDSLSDLFMRMMNVSVLDNIILVSVRKCIVFLY